MGDPSNKKPLLLPFYLKSSNNKKNKDIPKTSTHEFLSQDLHNVHTLPFSYSYHKNLPEGDLNLFPLPAPAFPLCSEATTVSSGSYASSSAFICSVFFIHGNFLKTFYWFTGIVLKTILIYIYLEETTSLLY